MNPMNKHAKLELNKSKGQFANPSQQYLQKLASNKYLQNTLPWSSINNNANINNYENYQQIISPLNYKVSNPSSSLIMSSLSNIHEYDEGDINTTQSTISGQILGLSQSEKGFRKQTYRNQAIHNDFYEYLIQQNVKQKRRYEKRYGNRQISTSSVKNGPTAASLDSENIKQESNRSRLLSKHNPISSRNQYIINSQHQNMQQKYQSNSLSSSQQSLHQLEQSQQELSFLKCKLQEAYEKLQKQILNSYQLQQKYQYIRAELQAKHQLLQLQAKENQKLKFTLKAILKNKTVLQQSVEKQEKKKSDKDKINEQDRENQLKQILKLKLQLKQIQKIHQDQIRQLNAQNSKIAQKLNQANKQLARFQIQITKKDKYLETFSQDLQNFQQIRLQNKRLLVKQTQYLNKINVLQSELRRVTDQKITSINRLKHEIALIQNQNGELLNQNQQLAHQNSIAGFNIHQNPMMGLNGGQNIYSPNSAAKRKVNRSCSQLSATANRNFVNNKSMKTSIITDSQDDQGRQIHQVQDHQRTFNQFNIDSLNQQCSGVLRSRTTERFSNKQNIASNNLQQNVFQVQSQEQLSKGKTVGKWKRAQSASNNSSTYFQSLSNDQNQSKQSLIVNSNLNKKTCQIQDIQMQSIIESKLRTLPKSVVQQSQDQKLTKYQQHRKNLQSQLVRLQKIKHPSKQQRQKMDKLQKQLYYVDSDIAGLKRKIRRKY